MTDSTYVPAWADQARANDLLVLRAVELCPEWFARLERRFVPDAAGSGCELWIGGVDKNGYGRVRLPKSIRVTSTGHHVYVKAHRARFVGCVGEPVAYGMALDHVVCDIKICGTVAHLCVTTPELNTRRFNTSGSLTMCRQGIHELSLETTRESKARQGVMECAECSYARNTVRTCLYDIAAEHVGLTQWECRKAYGMSLDGMLRIVKGDRALLVRELSSRATLDDLLLVSGMRGPYAEFARDALLLRSAL